MFLVKHDVVYPLVHTYLVLNFFRDLRFSLDTIQTRIHVLNKCCVQYNYLVSKLKAAVLLTFRLVYYSIKQVFWYFENLLRGRRKTQSQLVEQSV